MRLIGGVDWHPGRVPITSASKAPKVRDALRVDIAIDRVPQRKKGALGPLLMCLERLAQIDREDPAPAAVQAAVIAKALIRDRRRFVEHVVDAKADRRAI